MVRLAYNESEDRHYVSLGWEWVLSRSGPRSPESREKCWGKGLGLPLRGSFLFLGCAERINFLFLGVCKQILASPEERTGGRPRLGLVYICIWLSRHIPDHNPHETGLF